MTKRKFVIAGGTDINGKLEGDRVQKGFFTKVIFKKCTTIHTKQAVWREKTKGIQEHYLYNR